MKKERKHKIVAISGGFDPIHVGHLKLIQDASKFGKVVVILNSNQWLIEKKGYYFMTHEERAELLKGMKKVHKVVLAEDEDSTVCRALEKIKPDYFANGGSVTSSTINKKEIETCERLGIEMVWDMGGSKVQSSSELVEKLTLENKKRQPDMETFKDIIDSFHSINCLKK